jgi:Uma2 family endonuclease
MTIAQELEFQQGILPDVIFPPGDLYSDEPPLASDLHLRQIILLLTCLEWLWQERNDFYAAGNLTIYYSHNQKKSEYFRGPDFFVVLGCERKTRKSWVVWEEEGKYPNVILEILSDSTASIDEGLKKEIYQDTFRTLDYFWYDPYTQEFAGFHLVDGKYQSLQASELGYLWSQQLGLYLGVNEGLVRFFTADGQLVQTPEESAQQAQQTAQQTEQRLEQTQQRLEQAQQTAQRLAAKLRELNIDPDTI